MIRSFRIGFLAALLAVIGATGIIRAADTPLAGNWKFKLVNGGGDGSVALLQIENKDGKPAAGFQSILGLPPDAKPEDLKIEGNTIRFTFKVGGNPAIVTLSAAKGEEKPKTLRGTIELGRTLIFTELERTDLKELDRAENSKRTPAGEALQKVMTGPPGEREAGLKELIEKHADSTAAYAAGEILLGLRVKAGAKEDELRATTDAMLKVAKNYGPVAEKRAILGVAQNLVRAEKVSPLAVEFARKAEKGLTKEDSPATSVMVLKTLATALNKTGKADEAKVIAATIAKLDAQLDEEFEKTAIPFKPEAPAGRKGKNTRVAVVELFTGAQCPPCVSADIAFDAAVKMYKPADALFLEYHLHIPGPDALTNSDTEGRQKYYGSDIRGTPTAFVNGKVTEPLGGFKQHGEDRYGKLRKIIDDAVNADDQATLKLNAARRGDKIEAEANIADLKKTGEKVRLRFVLVEDVAHYAGSNGQRLHHHVVRALPGGLEGVQLKEAKGTHKVAVALGDLKKDLNDYLGKHNFTEEDRPMELKNLKLIALIQDDENKEILQAAQVDLVDVR